jgi:hypothetical protein
MQQLDNSVFASLAESMKHANFRQVTFVQRSASPSLLFVAASQFVVASRWDGAEPSDDVILNRC